MIFRIIAILILLVFYTFYFAKIVIQKKQSIKTNQMGIGNKPKKVLRIERIMSLATVLACVIGVGSIFMVKHFPVTEIRIVGVLVGILGVIFFALATITMKTSWRVGIPEEKTTLITQGIYRISRNPAFVGFDLLYLSICLMFIFKYCKKKSICIICLEMNMTHIKSILQDILEKGKEYAGIL